MKFFDNMNSQDKVLSIFLIGIVVTISSIAWAICYRDVQIERANVEAGYERAYLPGKSECVWQKAK